MKIFFYFLCVFLFVKIFFLGEDYGQEIEAPVTKIVEKEKYRTALTLVRKEGSKPKEYSFNFEPKEKGFYDLEFWQANYREKDSLTLKKTIEVENLPYDRTFKFTSEVYRVEIKYTKVGKIESTHIELR